MMEPRFALTNISRTDHVAALRGGISSRERDRAGVGDIRHGRQHEMLRGRED